eukprot:COSAG04_NODE_7750_length_1073_cov_1.237166_3_plen_42_part_01
MRSVGCRAGDDSGDVCRRDWLRTGLVLQHRLLPWGAVGMDHQ